MTLIKQGTLSVAVSFASPLHEVVMMVAMLVYDNLIEVSKQLQPLKPPIYLKLHPLQINEHRQVIADFTS